MAKIYLYLARRDKKGLKVVSILEGPETHPVRLSDVEQLNLPKQTTAEIKTIIHHNRMYWEPWVESADSYEDLKKAVRGRGYQDVPVRSDPIYNGKQLQTAIVLSKLIPTMLQKGS